MGKISPPVREQFSDFGVPDAFYVGRALDVKTPISGEVIARVPAGPAMDGAVEAARAAFLEWRDVPSPKRGELVRPFVHESVYERFLPLLKAACASVSDCWKADMRLATNTINYGTALPLAQGVKFDIARLSPAAFAAPVPG